VHADQRTAAGRLSERVAELERLTQTDEVTGLANRRHWLQTARGMIHASASGAIVLVDVDNFRQINERFGSAAADTVLHTIGAIVSKHGHAGRLGSDAFALLAPGDLNTAAEVANRIVAQIQEAFEAGSGPKVDVSIGCSAAPQHGIELPEILEAADMALVDAKRAGRSRTSVAGNEFSSSDQFAA
jgi:diguanylate cyclase (GGDEF)-like protein